MVHFIVKCEKLEEARSGSLLDRGIRDPEEMMRKLLFREERGQEVGRMIQGCHGPAKSGNVRKFCLKSGKIFINEMVNLVMQKSGNFVLYQE